VDRASLVRLGVEYEVIDASGCIVAPGFIDPHSHLLGGSGEGGHSLQSPEVFVHEITIAGITSVVGTLGVDTTMKGAPGLLARVKALEEIGLSSWMWTGGYNVPPTTIIGSVREDMLFIDEVVGAGEIAISDERGLNQSAQELAKLVRDTHVGGLLTGKAGRTHFHVGEEKTRLKPLRDIVEDFQVKCEWLYPTHIHRSKALLNEAVALAKQGAYVDMDVVDEELDVWVCAYVDAGGPLDRLTISSDSDSSTPQIFYQQLCGLVTKLAFPLERALALVTRNTAEALKLKDKGRLDAGRDGDVTVIEAGTLEVRDVIAKGQIVVRDGEPLVRERWLEKSKRNVTLLGDQRPL
jgi:beta-aspartyl-dipeptidase (metallo-type)